MAIVIQSVDARSPAQKAGIQPGDCLEAIGGHRIQDVLDYRFYMMDASFSVSVTRDGKPMTFSIQKGEYEELGLEFDTYLMDKQHHCANKCVFCFVDQLPKGLRESLYFKDDDSRMSFLFGSYVTLTNMTKEDIERVIKLRLSPINISVHTTNPELRVKMMANPRSGEVLEYLPMLTKAGIKINTQIVLCPGLNDKKELERTLTDLCALGENLESVAIVPVGLTKHREGLYPLRLLRPEEAADAIRTADSFGERMKKERGERVVYCADELYIQAGIPLPSGDYYDGYPQLDNGVGTTALLDEEFESALEDAAPHEDAKEVSLICGLAAQPYLEKLLEKARGKFPNVFVHVYGIENNLFGPSITVSGLLCGKDILSGLAGKPLGRAVYLPAVMLRHEKDKFLDDMTLSEFEGKIGVPVHVLEPSGETLVEKLFQTIE